MGSNSKLIHVDFQIDRRDLFRVNLDLAKWRLAAGLLVVVILISALTYFFLLIDEGPLLLQLSPLFIAMPIVAAGGQVLRLHAACRRLVSKLPESQRRFQYLFHSEMDGYDLSHGESYTHVAWKDVSKAIERRTCFVLYLNSIEARIVPKRGFHEASDIPVLRSILCAKLGARARSINR